MPMYRVLLNEVFAITYEVEAGNEDEAVAEAKSLEDPDAYEVDREWLCYFNVPEEDDIYEIPEQ